jgi:hypothetical protein
MNQRQSDRLFVALAVLVAVGIWVLTVAGAVHAYRDALAHQQAAAGGDRLAPRHEKSEPEAGPQ